VADVDIREAVVVDIDDGHPAGPSSHARHACFRGDVAEVKMSFVEIQFTGHRIPGEEDIGQAVVVEIPDADPAAVVDVHDVHRVDGVGFGYLVIESDPCAGGRQLFEQPGLVLTGGQPAQGCEEGYVTDHLVNIPDFGSGSDSGPGPPAVWVTGYR